LIDYAKKLNIDLFATAFDFKSANFLAGLDMPAFKIASGDLTNTPLLKHIAKFGKPMILSTGGGTLDDVKRAYDTIIPINPQLCILQCTASYPIENYADMNLRVISVFRETFPDIIIGSSDHESGIAMALVAYMLGARVVEKHFTLSRKQKGPDHFFAIEPQELAILKIGEFKEFDDHVALLPNARLEGDRITVPVSFDADELESDQTHPKIWQREQSLKMMMWLLNHPGMACLHMN